MAQKHLAILMTDIIDSVRMKEEYGDEWFASKSQQQKSNIVRCVESSNGHTVKDTGDGLIAVFDDSVDAVRSAVRASRIVIDSTLRVRFGIDMGRVAATDDGDRITDVHGLAVDRAARIMGCAKAFQVLCSTAVNDDAHSHLREELTFRSIGPRYLKGVGAAELFEVVNANLKWQPLESMNGNGKTSAAAIGLLVGVIIVQLLTIAMCTINSNRLTVLENQREQVAVLKYTTSSIEKAVDEIKQELQRITRR